jgi:hypothetical protein
VRNDSQTATQLDQAYRRMAAEARYRPAAARGDDEALRFCAQNVTDPVEVIMAPGWQARKLPACGHGLV